MAQDSNSGQSDSLTKNMEKVMALSQLMGNSDTTQQLDLSSIMEMAKKMKTLIGMFEPQQAPQLTEQSQKEPEKLLFNEPEVVPFSQTRQTSILQAAIPFLDKRYQKTIFMLSKIMEIQQMSQLDTITMQSSNVQEASVSENQKKMMQSIRPFLKQSEQKQMDNLMRLFKIREAVNILNWEEL